MCFDPVIFDINYANNEHDEYLEKQRSVDKILHKELYETENLDTKPFDEAINKIEQSKHKVFFITGKAGTGKSLFITYFRTKTKKNIAVVAPTGIAALNAKGETIHSFFGLPPRIIYIENDIKETNAEKYQALDILIIDEISMVRADLFDAIETSLRLNGPKKGEPFGGVKVIAIGDLYQLEPVVTKHEEAKFLGFQYKHTWFTAAHCFKNFKLEIDTFEFTKVYRQTDSLFIELLNSIRINNPQSHLLKLLNEKVSKNYNDNLITLTCRNVAANQRNEINLKEIPGSPTIYDGTKEGKFELNETALPAPLHLYLKAGAQVMFLKNDTSKKWVNGTIGKVVELHDKFVKVEINNDLGKFIYDVGFDIWRKYKIAFDKTPKMFTFYGIAEKVADPKESTKKIKILRLIGNHQEPYKGMKRYYSWL